MTSLTTVAAALAVALAAVSAHAQVASKPGLTLEGARRVIAAATVEARRLGAPGGSVAVVDDGGNLMALERLDGSFAASAAIAVGKARTAAIFQRSTKTFEEVIRGGRTPMLALADFTPLQGGVPLVVDGRVVGAVGVSGAASAQQDEELALIGAAVAKTFDARAARREPAVTYLGGAAVAAAFAKGMPLLEVDGYKVHASRRDGPGVAEVHDAETDVIYVLDGTATIVTGGAVVEPRLTEPGQVRGPSIEGGEARRLARGDVVVIPAGVPHWFKEVPGPFTYFVVKPIAVNGAGQ